MEITDGAKTRVVHVNRLRYHVQPEASPLMNTSYKEDWQPPNHFLVEGTPPVLAEHTPPEEPGVDVPEEPDIPVLEQVRPSEGFAA